MARDGLLPPSLARVSGRGSPVRITIFTAVVVAVLAGLIPLAELAALANAGTLTAFIAVAVCMLVHAPARARCAAPVPHALGLAGRDLRHPRLPLSDLQPAAADPDLVRSARRSSGCSSISLYGARRSVAGRGGGTDADAADRLRWPALPRARRPGAKPASRAGGHAAGRAARPARAGSSLELEAARAPGHRRQFPALCRRPPASTAPASTGR